jgi:hypothetical protein
VSLHVQTNKQIENKNKLLGSAVSAPVTRLWRNWSPSNGQQEHEKYKRNKMQADFRRDPPSHEACRINRIIYVPSATATDTALLGKIKAIPFIIHPLILITSSLPQQEVKTRLFGCPSPNSVTIPTELRRPLIVVVADFMPSCSVRNKRQKLAVLLLLFVPSYEFIN